MGLFKKSDGLGKGQVCTGCKGTGLEKRVVNVNMPKTNGDIKAEDGRAICGYCEGKGLVNEWTQ